MRISISGCANSGKSTLVEAFKKRWPNYKFPNKTYRDVLVENGLEHSSKTNEETQLHILNWMMEEQLKYPKDSHVIYDRCPLDNLVYTLQGNQNGLISDEVAAATISFVKESMKQLDIIFWIEYDPRIKIVNDGMRDADKAFIVQTDSIFKDLFDQYSDNLESDLFFPKEDCPAIIKIEGLSVDDRLSYIGEFIDQSGNLIETTKSILDPENIDILEKMIKDQTDVKVSEEQIKRVMKNIKG